MRYAILGHVRDGYAASFRVVVHDEGEKIRAGWCAFYSRHVLSNGWEPFDQPASCSYMPIRFRDLDRLPLGESAMFLERVVRSRGPMPQALEDVSWVPDAREMMDRVHVIAERVTRDRYDLELPLITFVGNLRALLT